MGIDRAGLAEFLRRRRASLQPENVGLPRGPRRRTAGLRREEVAAICHLSSDYYSRLERGRGPHPSEKLVSAIARGMQLTLDERDHLFHLAGLNAPVRHTVSDQISPGMLRIFDSLSDTPAEIVTELGETLRQSAPAVALTGDLTSYTGPRRSIGYRWFTDPETRALYHPEDHEHMGRVFAARARRIATLRGPGSRAARLAEKLLDESPDFAALWGSHEVDITFEKSKRFIHPVLGCLDFQCQHLHDPGQSHVLLVYTADPGTDCYRKLQLLSTMAMLGTDVYRADQKG